MKLALLGYGKMNQIVERQAVAAGHTVACIVSSKQANAYTAAGLIKLIKGCDVAIDFSTSAAALTNVAVCLRAGVPLVEGTTGWHEQEQAVRQSVEEFNGKLIYGANFSVGVNLFYRIVERAAELFAGTPDYDAFIEEAHHARKRDAPSGTALRLRDLLTRQMNGEVPVASTRAGHIPGTHTVGFDSVADSVTLTHTARSREGFAAGALLAAEWITRCEPGVYEFSAAFDEILFSAHNSTETSTGISTAPSTKDEGEG